MTPAAADGGASRGTSNLSALAPGSTREEDRGLGDLAPAEAERIARKPLRPYRFVRWVVAPLLRTLLRVRREEVVRIPKRGPVILASNHVSSFDPIVVLVSIRRPYVTLAKAGLFRTRPRRFFFQELGGLLRVDRARGGNTAAVDAAAVALRHGKLFAIWPEGGRSPTGHLTRGHTGVGRIALHTGVPVYPVAVLGTHKLRAKGARRTRWGTRVTLRVGEPLVFPDRAAESSDRAAARAVTDEIMSAIAQLMGPAEAKRYARLIALDLPPGTLPPAAEESPDAEETATSARMDNIRARA